VTCCGAVQLGKYVACDSFDETRPLRVVTHAHADHLMGLSQSLENCKKVLMTPATKDLVNVLRSQITPAKSVIETLDYGRTLQHNEERITFFKADHILGAAQVLVEGHEEERIVYTGDFRIDQTPVLESDTLVIEATYGCPDCKRSFNVDVKEQLVSKVKQGLEHGTVYVFGYHGKLQEVMQILNSTDIKAPFVASGKVFQISEA